MQMNTLLYVVRKVHAECFILFLGVFIYINISYINFCIIIYIIPNEQRIYI